MASRANAAERIPPPDRQIPTTFSVSSSTMLTPGVQDASCSAAIPLSARPPGARTHCWVAGGGRTLRLPQIPA